MLTAAQMTRHWPDSEQQESFAEGSTGKESQDSELRCRDCMKLIEIVLYLDVLRHFAEQGCTELDYLSARLRMLGHCAI